MTKTPIIFTTINFTSIKVWAYDLSPYSLSAKIKSQGWSEGTLAIWVFLCFSLVSLGLPLVSFAFDPGDLSFPMVSRLTESDLRRLEVVWGSLGIYYYEVVSPGSARAGVPQVSSPGSASTCIKINWKQYFRQSLIFVWFWGTFGIKNC